MVQVLYCRSGNIREVLHVIFANIENWSNQESHENYYYDSATKEKKIREF